METLRPTTDGVVTIRPPAPGDAAVIVAGRDAESHRFIGPGAKHPAPVGVVVVDETIVGWVDYDTDAAHTTATLVIHPDNVRSLALAARLSFTAGPDLDGNRYFTRELQNR